MNNNQTEPSAPTITVCDKCLQASCWQGIFLCQEAQNAGTVEKTVEELQVLGLENPSYWQPSNPSPDRPVEVDLERLRELDRQATAGPWTRQKSEGCIAVASTARGTGNGVYATPPGGSFPSADANLVAEVRTALPAILSHITALTQDKAGLEERAKTATSLLEAYREMEEVIDTGIRDMGLLFGYDVSEGEGNPLKADIANIINCITSQKETLSTTQAALLQRDGEVVRLRGLVEKFFASCTPHPVEHPTMYLAWAEAGDYLTEQASTPSPGAVEQGDCRCMACGRVHFWNERSMGHSGGHTYCPTASCSHAQYESLPPAPSENGGARENSEGASTTL